MLERQESLLYNGGAERIMAGEREAWERMRENAGNDILWTRRGKKQGIRIKEKKNT